MEESPDNGKPKNVYCWFVKFYIFYSLQDTNTIGYYYAAPSSDLKDAFAPILRQPILRIRNEQGWEIFYNVAVTPWLILGADLQISKPSLANDTAVFPGLRTVIKF